MFRLCGTSTENQRRPSALKGRTGRRRSGTRNISTTPGAFSRSRQRETWERPRQKRRFFGKPSLMPIGTPSIISRPLEAGFFCSHWTIFSMTTSRPSSRSTVSCPLNPRALPGRLRFPGRWHSRAPRNASWTDSPLRDRRSRRLWGNRNGRLAQRSCVCSSVRANRPDTATKSQGNLFFSGGHNGGQDIVWKSITPLYKMRYLNSRYSPQGSLWRERPPRKGDEKCAIWCAIVIPARWRTLKGKRGVAPSTFSPIVRHHLRRAEGGRAGHSRAAL